MSRLLILHASQSGNVIETSERISREAHQRHLSVEMKSMDEYDWIKLPEEKLVIFVCSVIGQGEEPDKMKVFLLSINFYQLLSTCINLHQLTSTYINLLYYK